MRQGQQGQQGHPSRLGKPDPRSGAALVEFTLLLPIFLMLLFGLVTSGLAFNHKLSLTHGARETGRYGATLPVSNFGGLSEWLDDLAARAVQNAGGSLDPGAPGFEVCVAYLHPVGTGDTDRTLQRYESPEGTVDYAYEECFPDGRPVDERRVQVSLTRTADIQAFVFNRTVTLTSKAVTKFEAGGL